MKHIKYLAAVSLLLVGCTVSYFIGYSNNDTKNYEAACLQADFIRYLIDHFDGETECFNIGAEIENSYEEWFQELDSEGFNTNFITNIKDFEQYSWCY